MAPLAPVGPGEDAIEELKRQLKENQSQRTEVTGHINQVNIQLHRWQHRLNMLNERQKELEAQLAIVTDKASSKLS
jgi:chromosome segregation ATPase